MNLKIYKIKINKYLPILSIMEKVAKYKIVFVRHGESTWNKENRFTGWTDVPLSEQGNPHNSS